MLPVFLLAFSRSPPNTEIFRFYLVVDNHFSIQVCDFFFFFVLKISNVIVFLTRLSCIVNLLTQVGIHIFNQSYIKL